MSVTVDVLLQIRVNALVCLGKMLEHLDRYAVLDDIIPVMHQIPSKEPPTLMAILGEVSSRHIHLDEVSISMFGTVTRALPYSRSVCPKASALSL